MSGVSGVFHVSHVFRMSCVTGGSSVSSVCIESVVCVM